MNSTGIFFFLLFNFLTFHSSPPLTQYTAFIGISTTTLFFPGDKMHLFAIFSLLKYPPISGLDKLNGEMMLWSTRFRTYILWDKKSFPPHSGKYSSHGAGSYLLLALPWTKVQPILYWAECTNKDREQSFNIEVMFYKSSFRWKLYYTCQFFICWKVSEQVVLPKSCLNAVRQMLLFVFPSPFFSA